MPAEQFDFFNAEGLRLAGLLDNPPGEARAYALFAHCFTCGKDVHAAKRIAEGLTALGIAVLRFDFTGLGSSEGEFANTTFSSNVADLVAAADQLRRVKRAPALLIGKLFRMLGADAVVFPNHGGRFGYSPDTCRALARAALDERDGLRPCVPVPAGGMTRDRVPEMLDFYGVDIMLLIGGALLEAGAQMVDATSAFVTEVQRYRHD